MTDGPPKSARGTWTLPIRILRMALWFAILAAWGELAILAFRKYALHRPTFSQVQKMSLMSDYRNFWMVPLADALVFLLPMLIIAIAAMRWTGSRILFLAVALCGFLTTLSLLFNFTSLHPAAALLLGAGAGVQIARVVSTRAERFHNLVRRSLGWMVAAVLLMSGGAIAWRELTQRRLLTDKPAAAESPNVLLIILDTVRGFNLSAYGY
ncbi:MAG: hypothetical protein ABI877_02995, partial [Gemmatimonadaceae bacterium]